MAPPVEHITTHSTKAEYGPHPLEYDKLYADYFPLLESVPAVLADFALDSVHGFALQRAEEESPSGVMFPLILNLDKLPRTARSVIVTGDGSTFKLQLGSKVDESSQTETDASFASSLTTFIGGYLGRNRNPVGESSIFMSYMPNVLIDALNSFNEGAYSAGQLDDGVKVGAHEFIRVGDEIMMQINHKWGNLVVYLSKVGGVEDLPAVMQDQIDGPLSVEQPRQAVPA